MSNKPKFRVTAAPRVFTDKNGQEKKSWPSVGVVFQNTNSLQLIANQDIILKRGDRLFLFENTHEDSDQLELPFEG